MASTGRIAATATDVVTNTSVQAKGHAAGAPRPETDEDRRRREHHITEFMRNVHEATGTPYEVLQRVVPGECLVLEIAVEEVFDQTPGPAAGKQLAPVPT
jgi:hypothetical protein